MQVKTVKISELRPHPKNPRVHPDSADEVTKMFLSDMEKSVNVFSKINWKHHNFFNVVFGDKMWLKPTLERKQTL